MDFRGKLLETICTKEIKGKKGTWQFFEVFRKKDMVLCSVYTEFQVSNACVTLIWYWGKSSQNFRPPPLSKSRCRPWDALSQNTQKWIVLWREFTVSKRFSDYYPLKLNERYLPFFLAVVTIPLLLFPEIRKIKKIPNKAIEMICGKSTWHGSFLNLAALRALFSKKQKTRF